MTITWADLPRPARALRLAHGAIAVVELGALGYVWWCALTRRRTKLLALAVTAMAAEAGALVMGQGDCPLGPLQAQAGDATPLFELVLPPRAAKLAVPMLAACAGAAVAVVLVRPPLNPHKL
jgi:hypothetical protein